MINGYCVTNLDGFKDENWPTKFSCKPGAGDCVEAASGKMLRVVSVTHRIRPNGDPALRVELHTQCR